MYLSKSIRKNIRENIPSYEKLLELLKETGEFKMVVEKLGYIRGTCEFQAAYYVVRDIFINNSNNEWRVYFKSSRNRDISVQVLRLRRSGLKINEIGDKLGIGYSTVGGIISRNMDEFERTKARTYAWENGHSKKSLDSLKSPLCIKKRLIRLNIKEPICEECGWDFRKQEKYLKISEEHRANIYPLQLHHKDGNENNNMLENLKFLCPNCHSLEVSTCRSKERLKRLMS